MNLAYSTLAAPDWTVEEAADAVSRYNFDGIEWRLADGEPITSHTPTSVLRRMIAATQSRGLRVPALDSSCRVLQVDATDRHATIHEGEFMVNLAIELGAPAVRVFGGLLPDGLSIEDALVSAAGVLHTIAKYAAAHQIHLMLETHDPAWSHTDNAVALADAAGEPTVGIVYDVLHPYRVGESVNTSVSLLGRHIELVHVKDGHRPRHGSVDWSLCAIGEGDVPLEQIVAALNAQGYSGWYTFEWEKRWHQDLAEPEIALPAGVASMRVIFASAGSASAAKQ